MTNEAGTQIPGSAPDAARPKPAGRAGGFISRMVYLIASVVFIIVSLARIYAFFFPSLPDCDGSVARETLSNILRGDNYQPSAYEDMRTLAKSKDELTCNAKVKLADSSLLEIAYRIFWKDKDAYFEITDKTFNREQKG